MHCLGLQHTFPKIKNVCYSNLSTYGTESVSNLGANLCNLLLGEIKNSSSLTVSKNEIRK